MCTGRLWKLLPSAAVESVLVAAGRRRRRPAPIEAAARTRASRKGLLSSLSCLEHDREHGRRSWSRSWSMGHVREATRHEKRPSTIAVVGRRPFGCWERGTPPTCDDRHRFRKHVACARGLPLLFSCDCSKRCRDSYTFIAPPAPPYAQALSLSLPRKHSLFLLPVLFREPPLFSSPLSPTGELGEGGSSWTYARRGVGRTTT